MDRYELSKAREEATRLFNEMRSILDENPNGLDAETSEKYDRIEADHDAKFRMIQAAERLDSREGDLSAAEARSLALPAVEPQAIEASDEPVDEERATATTGYRAAFSKWLRNPQAPETRAALNKGTSSQGGYLVPETWANDLIVSLVAQSPILGLARQFVTGTAQPFHVPFVNYVSTPLQRPNLQTALITEGGSYVETEDTLGEAKFQSYKYGTVAKASDELIRDSLFNIDEFIRSQAASTLGYSLGTTLATGTGSSQPTGYNTSTNTVTAASATVITADELISVQHQIGVPYRANAVWSMSDSALQAARKLKDSYGRYLLQWDYSAGQPPTILGRPVYVDPYLPTVATGNAHTVYGDFSRGFGVRRVADINVKVLYELYAGSGQIGYRVDLNWDSKLLDTAALAVYKQA